MPGTELVSVVQTPLADGTALTSGPGNSGFAAGSSVGSGNTATFQSAAAMGESAGYRFVQAGANQNNWYLDLSSAVAKISARVPFRYSATPSASMTFLRFYSDVHVTNLGGFLITTTNRLQYAENGGISVTSTGTALTPGTDYVLQLLIDSTSGSKSMQAIVYPRASTTPTLSISGTPTATTASFLSLRWGIGTNSALVTLDTNNKLALGRDDFLLRSDVSNVAPVVNAGPDQSVEAKRTVTLTGTATDADGTIASTAWTQTGGPAVTLSGTGLTRTFTAPLALTDQTLTFKFSATDNSGVTSEDTVVVTARKALVIRGPGTSPAPLVVYRP